MSGAAGPEFSRRVELARLGSQMTIYPIAASSEECQALARRFDLLALTRLDAEVQLQRVGEGRVHLQGTFQAQVVQSCVVTLDPVESTLSERFSMVFASQAPQGSRVTVELEDEIIEPIEGNAIDIGEAVAQQLALLLDPYPRIPGAGLDQRDSSPTENDRETPEG
jgi:virulence-associated protein VagC